LCNRGTFGWSRPVNYQLKCLKFTSPYLPYLSPDIIVCNDYHLSKSDDYESVRNLSVLVDTHCHLNFDSFDPDRAELLERAEQAGVHRILNPGIDIDTSRAAVELAQAFHGVYAAVGVHPNDASGWSDSILGELRELAVLPKVVAIGEIGLDYYWQRTERSVQIKAFKQQLGLAADLGLPVVIHVRDASPDDRRAMRDALEILIEWQQSLDVYYPTLASSPGVLHSFSGDLSDARRAADSQFCVGITGPVTFKKAEILRQVAAGIPVNRLLIETDAPFLTPHPHRGERNEPAYVRFIAEKIAEVREMKYENFVEITTDNAERLFRWQVNS
jgi:TatD DNase family protein